MGLLHSVAVHSAHLALESSGAFGQSSTEQRRRLRFVSSYTSSTWLMARFIVFPGGTPHLLFFQKTHIKKK
jgi:hypothetical protein